MASCCGYDESQVISTNDFQDLMPSFWLDTPAGCPNLNHIHAVHLKGPRLDSARLRKALDELQARHVRLRAKLVISKWSGKVYLLKDDTPIPLHEIEGVDPDRMNLDLEKVMMTKTDPHPAAFAAYIFYNTEHSVLLLYFRHGPGDGRAIEVALAQLLRLYEGKEVEMCKSHMNYSEIINYDGTLSKEEIESWKEIEEEFPPVPRDAIHDTFVRPGHPEFKAEFAGICIEFLRFDAAQTKAMAKTSRSAGTTITGAIIAALQHATLMELNARGLESDAVSIGVLVNERSFLDKQYMQEMGNFASNVTLHSEVQTDFWKTARKARKFLERIMEKKASWPGFVLSMGMSSIDRMKLVQYITPELGAAMFEHGSQATISSLGVLTSFGQYDSFEVLENMQCSHVMFQGLSLNVCTSGASGVMTLSIQVSKNVVPNARGLALAVRQHLETMLSNLPAPDSTVEDSPTAAAFSASASAMEPLIAKNREKLKHAQKTGDGTMAMMGDTSGAYTPKTHCLAALVTIFGILSAGPVSAFPLYNETLIESGVFSWACEKGVRECGEQKEALRDLYETTFSMQLRFFILVGCAYDVLGPQKAAALGGLTLAASCGMVAMGVMLEAQEWPQTQWILMYLGLVCGDLGGNMASFGILAFMWHYPKVQAVFIGLSNASSQASGGLGLCISYMVSNGYSLKSAFLLLGSMGAVASPVFLLSCPTRIEFMRQAGRVLNTHPSSLDTSALISWVGIKTSLSEAVRVFKLHPLENWCMLLYVSFFMAGELICFSSLDTKFQRWFSQEDSDMLLQVYATSLVLIGIVLNPLSGILFDCLGFRPVFALNSLLALLVPLTLLVESVPVQLFHILAMVTWFAIFMNIGSKYAVAYAPPDLFGTFLGLVISVAGVLAYFIDQFLLYRRFEDLLVASCVNMMIGWLFSFILCVILWRKGLPLKPPKDGFR